jgi:putative transposase
MARLSRIVIPGAAHHVTQRGNPRQPVFFSDDRELYLKLVSEGCAAASVRCLAWCLMDNHVHLILVPETADGLRAALGEAHRRYTRAINFREGWRGYLFQGRFASYPMDDAHLMAAVRYVELNPVASKMVERAEDWPWSSARSHLRGRRAKDDPMSSGDTSSGDTILISLPLPPVLRRWHGPPLAHRHPRRRSSRHPTRQSPATGVLL